MTILDRLSRLLRANVNDVISKAEDPAKIIEQSLRDMKSAYGEARSEVADALAQLVKLEREAKTNETLASEYEKKAEEALRAGSEDLAREALRRAHNHKDLAKGFSEQHSTQQVTIDRLKTQLRALEARIDELESKKTLLLARQKTAAAGSKTLSSFDQGSAFDAFQEMENRITAMEDRHTALGQLHEEGDIDAQLRNLGRDRELSNALDALKAKIKDS